MSPYQPNKHRPVVNRQDQTWTETAEIPATNCIATPMF